GAIRRRGLHTLASERGPRVLQRRSLLHELLTRGQDDRDLLDDLLARLPQREFVEIAEAVLGDASGIDRVILRTGLREGGRERVRIQKREPVATCMQLVTQRLAVDARVFDEDV